MDTPRVSVIGLKPAQAHRVESQYGDSLDMRFIAADKSHSKIEAATASSDYVIVMTKFTSHEAQAAVRGHSGLIFCNGMESAVRRELDSILKCQSPSSFQS